MNSNNNNNNHLKTINIHNIKNNSNSNNKDQSIQMHNFFMILEEEHKILKKEIFRDKEKNNNLLKIIHYFIV